MGDRREPLGLRAAVRGRDAGSLARRHIARITFTNNLVAEGLSRATHSKGEHSKGGLIHDNVTGVLIMGNLYAHNRERNPLFKGGARGAIVNNLIYDPGRRAAHFNLHAREWEGHAYQRPRCRWSATSCARPVRPEPTWPC